MKIDDSKIYFIYIKIHENFEHDKDSNIEKSTESFKYENKILNQLICFFWQVFRKFLFNFLSLKR